MLSRSRLETMKTPLRSCSSHQVSLNHVLCFAAQSINGFCVCFPNCCIILITLSYYFLDGEKVSDYEMKLMDIDSEHLGIPVRCHSSCGCN